MFNSILVVAWATVFCQKELPLWGTTSLKVFCIVGMLTGVTWMGLGYRGREYGTYFLSQAARFEDSLPEYCRVCNKGLETRNEFWFPWAGSYLHLIGWPFLFIALHVVLLALSFRPDPPPPGG